jgi:putative holliday junction resolvase
MRILCIDLGDKRTGLAVGDPITRIASPVDVLEIPAAQRDGAALAQAIAAAARDHNARTLLVGLPLNMDGTEGPRAKLVRTFGERLAKATGLPVIYQDERLTSSQADWQMAQSGLTHQGKKARRDALAAAAILGDYLANLERMKHPEESGSEPEPGIGR